LPLNEQDMRYLELAMSLAEEGRGRTSPNPVVGAVIVAGDRILGEGYHVAPGLDHAEVAAMKSAVRRVEGREAAEQREWMVAAREVCAGATIYVTLEPCCTFGRTPPCTEALMAAGFARVVVGAVDPSPEVNGKGLELLRAAGMRIDVADGVLARRVKRQNDGWRKAVTVGLPFVVYKYAMSLDGRVATDSGDSRWISSSESRAMVHEWRAWSDAVVVGAGTLLRDDPTLTAREVACERQPLRVVVDRALSLRRESRLIQTVDQGPVLAVCGADVASERRKEVESWGVETVALAPGADGALEPLEVGRSLLARGAQTVLLEGGPTLAGAWWAAGLVDKIAAFVCPLVVSGSQNRGALCGGGLRHIGDASQLLEVEVRQVGLDTLISAYTKEAS
jgi:diaminohydroxyphosphoribosylaminopyrimidine deaminase / 5-amino-6-(5-phosphoribosylamino)uracil reductase